MKVQTTIEGKKYQAEFDTGELLPTQQVFILEMKPVIELPTVEKLLEWWGNCERLELNPVWEKAKEVARESKKILHGESAIKKDWFRSILKSKYFATAIRKAEEKSGASKEQGYHVFRSYSGLTNVIRMNDRSLPICGVEYFATEDGCGIYLEAMGEDIEHLFA